MFGKFASLAALEFGFLAFLAAVQAFVPFIQGIFGTEGATSDASAVAFGVSTAIFAAAPGLDTV